MGEPAGRENDSVGLRPILLGLGALILLLLAGFTSGSAPLDQAFREQGYAVGFVRTGTYSCASVNQIQEDLQHIFNGHQANAIRLYGQNCNVNQVPALMQANGFTQPVYAAAYCFPPNPSDPPAPGTQTIREIQLMATATTAYPQGAKVNIICNEPYASYLNIPEPTVLAYISAARTMVPNTIPLGIADTWHGLETHPTTVAAVDRLVVHVHPYWDCKGSSGVGQGADYVVQRFQEVQATYTTKPLVVGETGWPTGGPAACSGGEIPSLQGLIDFRADLLTKTAANNIPFFVYEYADELWQGGVQNNWGMHLVTGACKTPLTLGVFPPEVPPIDCALRGAVVGDINGDGIVDVRDYGVWRQHFGATACSDPADLNVDCIVDTRDYGLWRQNF
jgi:exo-beta-1,3-glucanase (GH17 family)